MVANVVMDYWIKVFIKRIVDARDTLHDIIKYVDDVNLITAWVRLGTRWESNNLEHREEWEISDKLAGRTQADVTMQAMKQAADNAIPWLNFTVDHPDLHEVKTVPMLDQCQEALYRSPGGTPYQSEE